MAETTASDGDETTREIPTDTHNSPEEEEEPVNQTNEKTDDEGLLLHYDVILCGTGLVQSILASALSRAGKSVLHCDGNDHYGQLDAVLTLPYLLETWAKQQKTSTSLEESHNEEDKETTTSLSLLPMGACDTLVLHSMHNDVIDTDGGEKLRVGTEVATPYGTGCVVSMPQQEYQSSYSSLAVSLQNWTLANGKSPIAFFGVPQQHQCDSLESYLAQTSDVIPLDTVLTQTILQQHSRSFALDTSPRLLYASGDAVQGMLTSGVSDYLEFKSISGLFWCSTNNKQEEQWQLSRVPCSKNDVFGSKLLTPMDKRRLMKFLQLTLDYAIAMTTEKNEQDGNDDDDNVDMKASSSDEVAPTTTTSKEEEPEEVAVHSLNERQLNQGRALARPQNKAVSTQELDKLKQLCLADDNGMDFETYLETEQGLSPRLRELVRYALALETSGGNNNTTTTSVLEGMTNLCRHVQALGRYGTTAFLVPLYGSGELSQAFCRSSAVHGGTYLLRRAPRQVLLSENGQGVRGVVLQGDASNNADTNDNDSNHDGSTIMDKTIGAKHVMVAQEAIRTIYSCSTRGTQKRILRRISILRGRVIRDNSGGGEEQRHAIIIPPESGTLGNRHAIHGLVLDEGVYVAPCVQGGCTVLHLTTTVDVVAADDDGVDDSVLEKAVESILASSQSTGGQDAHHRANEIFHVSFSHAVCDSTSTDVSFLSSPPQGLHVCRHTGQTLVVDTAFEQARQIFETICSDVDFLTLSEEMDTAVKERIGDRGEEDDDERAVLDSAMNMIGASPTAEQESRGVGNESSD